MNYRASRVSSVQLDQDRTFCEGLTFTVFGILVSNPTDQAVEIEFLDGSANVRFMVVCSACDSKVVPIEFVADGGLRVSGLSDSEVRVTLFHSHGG